MKKITGCFTAVATPFKEDFSVDFGALEKLIIRQIEAGVKGVVVTGTTGECPTLKVEEEIEIWKLARRLTAGKVKLLAGTGSNDTSHAIYETNLAAQHGVDGCMVVAPYYNKPNQASLYRHFEMLHNATNVDIILYNVPGRTGTDLQNDTVVKLSALPRVIGLKDATGDLSRLTDLKNRIKRPDFCFLCGEDDLSLPFNALGGDGVISVVSNVIPAKMQALQDNPTLELQSEVFNWAKVLFATTSPLPLKYALSKMGLCQNVLRPPLFPLEDDSIKAKIDALLA
jgi:4-hydroxy-tetrahydrodipicolinate synthase